MVKNNESKKKNPAKNKSTGRLSTTEFAERVGVSRQRILTAINSGVLVTSVTKTMNGKKPEYTIDEESGLKEWASNIDPSKQRDQDKAAATKDMGGKEGGGNYQKARAAKEFFNAKIAELEFHERAGKLISADRVKAESFKIGRRVRDSLMSVPERVAAELATMTEPREISIYLKEQIAAALKDLGDLNDVATRRA